MTLNRVFNLNLGGIGFCQTAYASYCRLTSQNSHHPRPRIVDVSRAYGRHLTDILTDVDKTSSCSNESVSVFVNIVIVRNGWYKSSRADQHSVTTGGLSLCNISFDVIVSITITRCCWVYMFLHRYCTPHNDGCRGCWGNPVHSTWNAVLIGRYTTVNF